MLGGAGFWNAPMQTFTIRVVGFCASNWARSVGAPMNKEAHPNSNDRIGRRMCVSPKDSHAQCRRKASEVKTGDREIAERNVKKCKDPLRKVNGCFQVLTC